MIAARVNKIPMVNSAISMGFDHYGKLKESNLTVGDLMTKAENWAVFLWEKLQPIVEKLQDPIQKADQLACDTFDFVETKLSSAKLPETILGKQLPILISSVVPTKAASTTTSSSNTTKGGQKSSQKDSSNTQKA